MKKAVSLILALVMCLSLCACNAGKQPGNPLGTMVSTDIMELTLDRAQLAVALENSFSTNNANAYGTPKEYDSADDASNPMVAAVGHTLVFVSFTCRNLDRGSIDLGGSFNPQFTSVEYNGKNYDNDIEFKAERKEGATNWSTYSSSNVLLSAGETCSVRGMIDIPVDATSLDDSFDVVFYLPNSSGKTEPFVYTVTAADVAAAIQREEAEYAAAQEAATAALNERKAETDAETVAAVKKHLQGEWEYTDYSSGYSTTNKLVFKGDKVTVTTTSMGMRFVKNGVYTVAKNDIFIDYEEANAIDCFLPYTLENGEFAIYPIENIES